jgi:hypothetical protein
MVWHFYGKTKTVIISSKNQFRPQFWAQIVVGVETHPYSPFSGLGDHFLAKLWRKPGSDFFVFFKKKKRNRHLYQDFWFCQTNSTITSYRTVRLGAPAKFIILHSKIGRRVDFARARYGTMQSESMRMRWMRPKLARTEWRSKWSIPASGTYFYLRCPVRNLWNNNSKFLRQQVPVEGTRCAGASRAKQITAWLPSIKYIILFFL